MGKVIKDDRVIDIKAGQIWKIDEKLVLLVSDGNYTNGVVINDENPYKYWFDGSGRLNYDFINDAELVSESLWDYGNVISLKGCTII